MLSTNSNIIQVRSYILRRGDCFGQMHLRMDSDMNAKVFAVESDVI